jgi:hypothetical protein
VFEKGIHYILTTLFYFPSDGDIDVGILNVYGKLEKYSSRGGTKEHRFGRRTEAYSD